jgi:adapter protein MecA 1/2
LKIERLTPDKIRIFLTFDDLLERGIRKDDMWREIPKVHELFSEMMEQAYREVGFEAVGPLAVEVFALPAQGLVVIVTRGHAQETLQEDDDEYEMDITLEQSDQVLYTFTDFDDVVMVSKMLQTANLIEPGRLYTYRNRYVLVIEPEELDQQRYGALIAILAEYGEAMSITTAMLDEYGKLIMAEDAVKNINHYF